MNLTDKVAFVTGSADGIGKGLANALLEKGVKVYLNDMNGELGEATLKEFQVKYGSDRVKFSVLDVTNEKQFQEVFDSAVKTFGRVHIMINNAGINDECNFDAILKVNVAGVMRGTRIAQEHMRTGNKGVGGRIINIASVHGFQHTYVIPAYCATKHAVRAYTTCLSLQPDKATQGVQYAALCPDTMDVGMINKPLEQNKMLAEYWELCQLVQKSAKTIPLSELVDGLMELLSLENMSGAMHAVCHEGRHYRKTYYEASPSFIPEGPAMTSGIVVNKD